jgi:hypothetical protein
MVAGALTSRAPRPLLAMLLLSACAAPGASVPTSTGVASPSAMPTAARTPRPTPPPDLVGEWRAETAGGDTVILHIMEDATYRVETGIENVQGMLNVEAGEVTLLGGALMCGVGTYQWSVEDDVLRLVSVEDACPGRRGAIDGRDFKRAP